jgi:16S rRNA (uracil1498-N3)-methyltransferase
MNYLFISKSDLTPSKNASLQAIFVGSRAAEAIKAHDLKSGLNISCVVEDLGRGKVKVGECSQEMIELAVEIEGELPARTPLDLVVAYSRPQTIKKILQLAASTGLRSLSFIITENVVPSYLQSKTLETAEIRKHLILGLEQSGDGVFPELNHFKNFADFIRSGFITAHSGPKIFGDSDSKVSKYPTYSPSFVLIGPESGLTSWEKQTLLDRGFEPYSLGPRSLRIEVAATMLLGRLIS